MFLYYAVTAIALVIASPFLLMARKRRAGIYQKLGMIPADIPADGGKAVWFHSVSVGEFNAIWPLIQDFQDTHPDFNVFVSTTTETAQNLARQKAGDSAYVFYFPLDLPFAIKPWLDRINPSLVVIAETEIWPGFNHECFIRSIPVVVVNGRISSRSFGSYHRLKIIFGPVLRKFSAIAAQTQEDKQRYLSVGGQGLPVETTGNLKFDGLKPIARDEIEEIRKSLNLKADELVIVAGSTHEGEESAVLEAVSSISSKDPDLGKRIRVVLVPRHPERFDRAEEIIVSLGFKCKRYSRQEEFNDSAQVFMLDTIGKLSSYYSVSDIAFVGGTLAPVGGHNLLEPYVYKTPVVCGPNLDKTRDIADRLMARKALVVAADASELETKLLELLNSTELRRETGESGLSLIEESRGAVSKAMAIVERHLPDPRTRSARDLEKSRLS